MNPHIERGLLLFEQSRMDLATQEFRQALATDPDNARAHSLLAICLANNEHYDEASEEAQTAIRLEPDEPFSHHSYACVLVHRNRFDDALTSLAEAIRIDPYNESYWAKKAAAHFALEQWQDTLEAAEKGLEIAPDYESCTNLRAMALVKLGRKEEAAKTIDGSLARNPDNALTHANMGWAYLEDHRHEEALNHFREALRLSPDLDWARQGMIAALKSKHFIYRWLLSYFLWMAKLSPGVRWGVIIGGYFAAKFGQNIAAQNPNLAPLVLPLVLAYFGFCIMTWIGSSLFNMLLLCSRYGRLVLSRSETIEAMLRGALLVLSVVLFAVAMYLDSGMLLVLFGTTFVCMLLVGAVFACDEGWPRTAMLAGLAGVVLFGMYTAFVSLDQVRNFSWIVLGSLFASNYLASVTVKH